ncbi:hypothetical protein, conserved [Babesia bigemina]|uniref:Cyclin N-terminal domain-containing protein n=1 Tax=Babesia bigemina TaxID=5866 RepID=A0A061D112_BABBI|nr:hypothetical protein, conserved [Babesia bigemina]CDR94303.1 hypothetical protein, conserved [Babesia bigemina]|eukprot:XP_012766489.1 hypothetical protein, conserved [Babesia bigemina]
MRNDAGKRQGGAEPSKAFKQQRTSNTLSKEEHLSYSASEVNTDLPSAVSETCGSSPLRERIRLNMRARFHLVSHFLSRKPTSNDVEEEKCEHEASDTILTLCKVLNQPYSVVLTSLVYLQMYRNASDRWRESLQPSAGSPRKMERHEQFLIAASCVLLAWKYREDDVRVNKSNGKIFEFTSVLYKVYVAQSKNSSSPPSVSRWMLQDEGKEILKLKSQLIEHENHLLHALNYHVGPVPLPHKLIPSYVRRFLIAIAKDLSDLQDLALKMDDLVGLLVLDCYKTRICLDYTPGEILVSCIFKAVSLLTVAGAYPRVLSPQLEHEGYLGHIKETEARLNTFISALGKSDITADRIAQCLNDMRRYVRPPRKGEVTRTDGNIGEREIKPR